MSALAASGMTPVADVARGRKARDVLLGSGFGLHAVLSFDLGVGWKAASKIAGR